MNSRSIKIKIHAIKVLEEQSTTTMTSRYPDPKKSINVHNIHFSKSMSTRSYAGVTVEARRSKFQEESSMPPTSLKNNIPTEVFVWVIFHFTLQKRHYYCHIKISEKSFYRRNGNLSKCFEDTQLNLLKVKMSLS